MPVTSVRTGRGAPSAACENALRLECTIAPFGRLTASSNKNVPGSVRTRQRRPIGSPSLARSEEHTSELQSPYDLVCRLLLEKKKNSSLPFLLASLFLLQSSYLNVFFIFTF